MYKVGYQGWNLKSLIVVIDAQLCHDRFPMDRALVGAGSGDLEDLPNPTTHCKLLTPENHQVLLSLVSFFSRQRAHHASTSGTFLF